MTWQPYHGLIILIAVLLPLAIYAPAIFMIVGRFILAFVLLALFL